MEAHSRLPGTTDLSAGFVHGSTGVYLFFNASDFRNPKQFLGATGERRSGVVGVGESAKHDVHHRARLQRAVQ